MVSAQTNNELLAGVSKDANVSPFESVFSNICTIQITVYGPVALLSLITGLLSTNSMFWWLTAILVISLLSFLTLRLLPGRWQRFYKSGKETWLIVVLSIANFAIAFLTGELLLVPASLLVTVCLSFALLSAVLNRFIIIFGSLGAALLVLSGLLPTYFPAKSPGFGATNISLILIELGLFTGFAFIVGIIIVRFQQTYAWLEKCKVAQKMEYNDKLNRLLGLLTTNLGSVSGELTSSLEQQATISEQQSSALQQINPSVEELSSTASSIASLAGEVANMTAKVAIDSQKVEATAITVAEQSLEALQAVIEAAITAETMGGLYEQLSFVFKDLKVKNDNTYRILEILEGITQETHLLSLNAAIEAAGTGVHGERFGVVAQEIRALADKAGQARKEISRLLQEANDSTLLALTSVESGYEVAQEMKVISERTATIIQEVKQIADHSQTQMQSINEVVQMIAQSALGIKLATQQQEAASQHILVAINDLNVLSKNNNTESNSFNLVSAKLDKLSVSLPNNHLFFEN